MSSRFPIVATTFAVLALLMLDAPSGASAAARTSANVSVDLVECLRGKQAKDRQAVFRGQMKQVGDGLRMQMRFALGEKVGSSAWTGVKAPGIGVWHEARTGVAKFAYRQRVVAMQKGTSYRAVVQFRWLAQDGSAVRRESSRSPVCHQPGKLPNLKIRDSVSARPGPTAETLRYAVKVGNTGYATATDVEVRLLVDGAEIDTRVLRRLKPGERRVVRFVGPRCGGEVRAMIDPSQRVRELSERDNAIRTPCSAVL
ncbi:MAG TPA: CARDB domain-containing protein [Thermoleophilaceae bacterium]|nr:CARDB domain-containing protein [Thermoleophilaceae bacterium]